MDFFSIIIQIFVSITLSMNFRKYRYWLFEVQAHSVGWYWS